MGRPRRRVNGVGLKFEGVGCRVKGLRCKVKGKDHDGQAAEEEARVPESLPRPARPQFVYRGTSSIRTPPPLGSP